MKKRFIAAAVPVLVAGSLAAAAPSMSQAAGDGPAAKPTPKASAQAAAVQPCVGGIQKRAMTGGHASYIGTNSSKTVPGTVLQFKGPKSKKDTVFVTLTAPWTVVTDNGDTGQVRVELDGIPLKPGALASEYFYSTNNYTGAFAGQYCAKVKGGGFHELRVIIEHFDDGDGSGESYLYNPMVHVEVAD